MRKLWILAIGLIGLAHAQTSNHIHHLFGLKQETPGLFMQAALNQQTGGSVEVETFSSSFNLGGTYAYYTSSNRVLYVDSLIQTVTLVNRYNLPEIYSSNYSGNFGAVTFQAAITAVCVNPVLDSLLYSFDFNSKILNRLNQLGGFAGNSSTLPELVDLATLNQAYFQNSVYLTSNNNNNGVAFYGVETNNLAITDSLTFPFQSMYLVADPQWGLYALAQNNAQQSFLLQINSSTFQLDTIAQLPSCNNCAQEEFNYDKNAIVIDSDNGHVILSREEVPTGLASTYFLSTYDLVTGDEIFNIQTADRWSNLIFQKPMDDLVYPGDSDHDKITNMLDLLPIGLRYNDAVVERLEISTEWIGQTAGNTGDTLVGGVDKKHADCNGDGQINAVDIDAIFENYQYVHYSEKSTQANCDFPLFVQFPSLVKENELVEVQIGLDMSSNPTQGIYGLVFTIEYNESYVDTAGMFTQGGSTWFGSENGDYLQRFYKEQAGQLRVGLVGIDQLNRNGGGVLLDGIWTMEDVVIPIVQGYGEMDFSVTNITLIDYDQNYLDGCGVDTVIRVYDKNVGINERSIETLPLFPNPTKQNFINLGGVADLDYAEMYDVQGRLLQSWYTDFEYLNLGDIPKGIYILKAYANETMYVNKLMYAKE
jgi:hypothetical protein